MTETIKESPIDMNYRPDTYWPESPTRAELLSRIKGQMRRQQAEEILEEEGIAGLNEFLSREELPDDQRQSWGRVHPMMMGGEYLPPSEPGEVEIVRISLRSTTFDQIALRALRVPEGVTYRFVTEYEHLTVISPFEVAAGPLSQGELIAFIDQSAYEGHTYGTGMVKANWESVYDNDCDVDEALAFVSISSPFYPQLGEYYALWGDAWAAERRVEEEASENQTAI